jgi:hypothetical protein
VDHTAIAGRFCRPSFLFKGMCDLQDAEIIAVTANKLDTDWQPVSCEARWELRIAGQNVVVIQ